MQFIENGPDIPDSLLQAHEEGKVVFFCGAGISTPAGLPQFSELVDEIYRKVGETPNRIEQNLLHNYQYDSVIDQLERRISGYRDRVRLTLWEILKPKHKRNYLNTHKALLTLAKNREGMTHIVTTNFDRIFCRAARGMGSKLSTYSAPMLPIPKSSLWDGLVHLHGALPLTNNHKPPANLVLSSGDFGLAYLVERWAARFVTELLKNYTVCFVGYRIGDPILRYMMDAIAADRMLGEQSPQAYAFGCHEGTDKKKQEEEWESKGVIPILYETPPNCKEHKALHQTIQSWSDTYRDGVFGKEHLITRHANIAPSASTQQDDFIGRMTWALSDQSGLPAKIFADMSPTPPLEWLYEFDNKRFGHDELNRFGVTPNSTRDDDLKFSLIHRPTPYTLSNWQGLLSDETYHKHWDKILPHLARWLTRHLNNPKLLVWITRQGMPVHRIFKQEINDHLDKIFRHKRDKDTDSLDEMRSSYPDSIPSEEIEKIWLTLLTQHQQPSQVLPQLWLERLKVEKSLSYSLLLELREMLSPSLHIEERISYRKNIPKTHSTESIRCGVQLSTHDSRFFLSEVDSEEWRSILPALHQELDRLLQDSLEMQNGLGLANSSEDDSSWHMPSISEHTQNSYHENWVIVIKLLRDSWLETIKTTPKKAKQMANEWFARPYPTFKRLALYAACQNETVPPSSWVKWLTHDSSWWLWSMHTRRETMRLLVLKGAALPSSAKLKLEVAILRGPPREMYDANTSIGEWEKLKEASIWIRLAKLAESGIALGEKAKIKFQAISSANPKWKIQNYEKDEFPFWISGTGDPDFEEEIRREIVPRKRKELVKWLNTERPESDPFYEDTWHDTCEQRFFHSFMALADLAKEGRWPKAHWRRALNTWSTTENIERSWRYVAPLLNIAPQNVLLDIARNVSFWTEKATEKQNNLNVSIFYELCEKILDLPLEYKRTNDPISAAINHPVGIATKALINIWLNQRPSDGDGLPEPIKRYFTDICDTSNGRLRHGRVVLASRLIPLFRVDAEWTKDHLLPYFRRLLFPEEATSLWQGFLWSPRFHQQLFAELKYDFLGTSSYLTELGNLDRQYIRLLTYIALDKHTVFTEKNLKNAIANLPQQGLDIMAEALQHAQESAGDQRAEYFKNRIMPFIQNLWPKSAQYVSQDISNAFARLCVATKGEYPSALSVTIDWITPLRSPYYITRLLKQRDICNNYPADALTLLDRIIEESPNWVTEDLKVALEAIIKSDPALGNTQAYRRLMVLVRSRYG